MTVTALRPPSPRAALAGIVLLAAALRFATLHAQSYWLDEVFTVSILRGDLAGLLDRVTATESTPPLYYLLAWVWTQAAGTGEVGLRSLSALLATATVPVVFAAGRALVSERAGLIAAALAAVNPLLVWYGQEARAYALLGLLTALSFLGFALALAGPTHGASDRRRSGGLFLWGAASALAVATHYFAVFFVAAEALWLLVALRSRLRVALALVPTVLAGAALVPLVLAQRESGFTDWTETGSLPGRVAAVAQNFMVGWTWTPFTHRGLVPVVGVLVVIALVLLVRRASAAARRGAAVAAGIAALSMALPFLLTLIGPNYLNARNLIAAWCPLAVVIAAGLAVGSPRRVAIGTALALGAVFLGISAAVPLTDGLRRDDWRRAAETLGAARSDRLVAVVPPYQARAPAHYLGSARGLPAEGTPATEIAVLQTAGDPVPRTGDRPPAPGFALAERGQAGNIEVVRFRARTPVVVTPSMLAGGLSAAVLIQRPVPSRVAPAAAGR